MTTPQRTPVAAPARRYSVFAVLALVLSLTPIAAPYDPRFPDISHTFTDLAVVLSVVFGIVALQRIKKHGQDGQLLAITGLAIAGVTLAWFAVWIVENTFVAH